MDFSATYRITERDEDTGKVNGEVYVQFARSMVWDEERMFRRILSEAKNEVMKNNEYWLTEEVVLNALIQFCVESRGYTGRIVHQPFEKEIEV